MTLSALMNSNIAGKLLRGGGVALLLKLGAAVMSFTMLVVLARAMSAEQYGLFGFGFSIATLLSVVGSFGQRNHVMRFAARYIHNNDTPELNGLMRYGLSIVTLGCLALAIALFCAALVLGQSYLAAAGLLTLAFGLGEYLPCAMRSFGVVFWALFPRDILWRCLVTAVGLLALSWPAMNLTATKALSFSALLLLAIVAVQFLLRRDIGLRRWRAPWTMTNRAEWTQAATGLWGNSIVQVGAPTLSVVVVGVLLPTDETGSFFAAVRTAMILQIFLMAVNIVAAPLISRYLAQDDMPSVQRMCQMISIGVGVPTILAALFFVFYGDVVLSMFGAEFTGAKNILIVLSLGYMVNALAGPTMQLMEMSGHERKFLAITLSTAVMGVALMLILGTLFGAMGVAVAMTLEVISWNVYCIIWIRRNLKVSTIPLPMRSHT